MIYSWQCLRCGTRAERGALHDVWRYFPPTYYVCRSCEAYRLRAPVWW